jgi:hypothetical protein
MVAASTPKRWPTAASENRWRTAALPLELGHHSACAATGYDQDRAASSVRARSFDSTGIEPLGQSPIAHPDSQRQLSAGSASHVTAEAPLSLHRSHRATLGLAPGYS